ncbi:MAG: heavy metal translocating P-type ATPase [Lachnospiraceae bacterium]|nr:heavy metal translocating P-type ATPase [Lachnospiraceae bacterium]
MSKKLKKRIKRVAIGAAVYIVAVLFQTLFGELPWFCHLPLFLAAYVIIGGDVVKNALRNIGRGQVFDENFLMMIATVGAFFVGDYPEAVAVMLFYQVGECFQSYAVGKSRKSITALMDIRPDYANVLRDGDWTEVEPDEVLVGECIMVRPGERIPLDGVIEKGSSSLDTMALTGESAPRDVAEGDEVISGCVNKNGVLEVKVSKPYGESTVARILDLVENASSKKAKAENFITKFAKYYTPVVVICAALLAVLPPVVLGGGWSDWIYRALSFLVISCPCALVISIPLSFFGGLGGASKEGILIKGSNYLETLADTEVVVMDKTGTLTKGNFAVSKVVLSENVGNTGIVAVKPEDISVAAKSDDETMGREERMQAVLLQLAAYAESYSNHPISKSLLAAYGREVDVSLIQDAQEIPGHGVAVKVGNREILAGNEKLLASRDISFEQADEAGTLIYIGEDNRYLGYILIEDEIKKDAEKAIRDLKASGVKKIVMLTGDHEKVAAKVAENLSLTDYYAELLPGDKVSKVEELFTEKPEKGKLAFVGDGINDAPVLARADIGIAMGGLGSDAAIEAADVVIMTDEPSKIARAMKISRKTLAIVKQNIVFAIGIKVLVLLLAAAGMASMWAAVFADVGVAVIAILNAMRALRA